MKLRERGEYIILVIAVFSKVLKFYYHPCHSIENRHDVVND